MTTRIIMFSSDNGPTWVGGSDLEFFDDNGAVPRPQAAAL